MRDKNKDKNRIFEVIIVNGIKYVKDAINTRLIHALIANKGSNVNFVSGRHLVKASSGFYI